MAKCVGLSASEIAKAFRVSAAEGAAAAAKLQAIGMARINGYELYRSEIGDYVHVYRERGARPIPPPQKPC